MKEAEVLGISAPTAKRDWTYARRGSFGKSAMAKTLRSRPPSATGSDPTGSRRRNWSGWLRSRPPPRSCAACQPPSENLQRLRHFIAGIKPAEREPQAARARSPENPIACSTMRSMHRACRACRPAGAADVMLIKQHQSPLGIDPLERQIRGVRQPVLPIAIHLDAFNTLQHPVFEIIAESLYHRRPHVSSPRPRSRTLCRAPRCHVTFGVPARSPFPARRR